MSNKSKGASFEREFCELLAGNGYFVHRMQDNVNGQPFDVVASKNNNPLVFDCKDCIRNTFKLSRIEENQIYAMKLWQETGNSPALFAIRFCEKDIYILLFNTLISLKNRGVKQITIQDADKLGKLFEKWIKEVR